MFCWCSSCGPPGARPAPLNPASFGGDDASAPRLKADIITLPRTMVWRRIVHPAVPATSGICDPALEGEAAEKKCFRAYSIGYCHIDIAQVQTAEGRLHLFVAVDRTSEFALTGSRSRRRSPPPAPSPDALIEIVPTTSTGC